MEGMDNVSGHAARKNNDGDKLIKIAFSDDDDNANEEDNVIGNNSGDNNNFGTIVINSDHDESEEDDKTKINKYSNLQDEE
ncbi:Hypothetical protein CINCED_3A018510, partial [Cinara cedri]